MFNMIRTLIRGRVADSADVVESSNALPILRQQLREAADHLVDIHGQHAWQSLTRPAAVRELRAHPDVAGVAVVGVPSEQWGETPVAYVVRAADASSDAPTLKAWYNARAGKTQRLADLRFIDELPRSAIGKVLKRELRDLYLSASN